MVGVAKDELAGKYPLLFHMAELGSWPSIERHGLRSTSMLLDLFEVSGSKLEDLEYRVCPESV